MSLTFNLRLLKYDRAFTDTHTRTAAYASSTKKKQRRQNTIKSHSLPTSTKTSRVRTPHDLIYKNFTSRLRDIPVVSPRNHETKIISTDNKKTKQKQKRMKHAISALVATEPHLFLLPSLQVYL